MEANACKGAGLGRVLFMHRVTTQRVARGGHQEMEALPGPYIWDKKVTTQLSFVSLFPKETSWDCNVADSGGDD